LQKTKDKEDIMNKELVAAQKKGRHGDTILAHISPKEALDLTLRGGAGTTNPKTGLPEFFSWGDLNPFSGGGGGFVGSVLTGGLSDLYAGIEKYNDGGSFYDLVDRAIDPGGTVDRSIRGVGGTGFGKAVAPVVDVVGPVVGGVVGGIYGGPAGAAGGAAAGGGFASKWRGDDNEAAAKRAAIAGGLAYLGGTVAQGMSGGSSAGAAIGADAMDAAAGAAMTGGNVAGSAPLATSTLNSVLDSATPLAEAMAAADTIAPTASVAEFVPTATEAAAQTTNPNLASILGDMGATAESNAAIAAGGAGGGSALATAAQPAAEIPATQAPLPLDEFSTPATTWDKISSSFNKAGSWATENPMKVLFGLNAINSLSKAGMMSGANDAQQKSYQDYLNTINAPTAVKNARFDTLAGNVRSAGTLAQQKIDDTLAARGVRGKGKSAPTGDLAEATRKSMNDAYNSIFSQYNVPSTPGPVNYSPGVANLLTGDMTQMAAQGIPLALILSKYGAKG
jgi:hypothetical protein